MSRVVGIDFSMTSAGVAVFDAGEWTTYTVKSSGKVTDPMLTFYDRILGLAMSIYTVIQPTPDDLIVIEGLGFASKNKFRDRMQFAWHRVNEVLVRNGTGGRDLVTVAPMKVKQFATGNGSADKADMAAACIDRLGHTPRTTDEADAVWVAVTGAQAAGLPIEVKPLPESADYMKEKKK